MTEATTDPKALASLLFDAMKTARTYGISTTKLYEALCQGTLTPDRAERQLQELRVALDARELSETGAAYTRSMVELAAMSWGIRSPEKLFAAGAFKQASAEGAYGILAEAVTTLANADPALKRTVALHLQAREPDWEKATPTTAFDPFAGARQAQEAWFKGVMSFWGMDSSK